MIRSESLKKNKDFKIVYQNGTSYANRLLVMYVLKNQHKKNRLGISVSKKVGNSVVRHRLTRLIRESYRLNETDFDSNLDISPMKRTKCPYIPTCSQYGLEAIEKYGAFRGSLLAVWRILRCNPFSHGGYDPVP